MYRPDQPAPHSDPRSRFAARELGRRVGPLHPLLQRPMQGHPHHRGLAAAVVVALLAALAPIGALGASAHELPPSDTASEVLSREADDAAYAAAQVAEDPAAPGAETPAAKVPGAEAPATETPAAETPATPSDTAVPPQPADDASGADTSGREPVPAAPEPPAAEPAAPAPPTSAQFSPAAAAFVAPAFVTGAGTSGSITVPITPGISGQIRSLSSGPAAGVQVPNPDDPASPITGSISGIDQQTFFVRLSPTVVFTRFELEVSNPAAEVDVLVYRADGVGGLVGRPAEPGPTAHEADDVFMLPHTADFRVVVQSFGPATDFVLRSFGSTSPNLDGSAMVRPSVLSGVAGVPANLTYSWTGLTPNKVYVGIIAYGFDGGGVERYTTVRIDTVEVSTPVTPINLVGPVITGEAEVDGILRVDTGEWDTADLTFGYQWQLNGVDIPGATEARYQVTDDDLGASLSAVVAARTVEGAVAESSAEPVVVKYPSKTSVSLGRSTVSVGQKVTIRVRVKSEGPVSGMVKVLVGDAEYDVALNERGRGRLTLTDLVRGRYTVSAVYPGSDVVAGSTSENERLRVTRKALTGTIYRERPGRDIG